MVGTTVSHYQILSKLGQGGMGVVYKAHDTDLDRDVALKFLPHHVTANEAEQSRFLQEARAAALLNHPHICTVHAIERAGEDQFIVMELVDGKMLSQLLPIDKTQTAIDYAIQIAEALQEAHSKGIVHRDIKADNIMVNSKNQIKVMDFGLAKLKGSLKLTESSSTVGTLAYMAPEQIEGGEADARSDIFSFGIVLYEMLTGHLPFRGEHEAAMLYSIVNEEPTPVQHYCQDISPEVIHIVERALEKNPEERYQSANDLAIDLRRVKKQSTRVLRPLVSRAPMSPDQSIPGLSAAVPRTKAGKRAWYIAGPVAVLVAGFLLWRSSSGWLTLATANWATRVARKGNDDVRRRYHRYSLFVWLVWLVPYFGGMYLGTECLATAGPKQGSPSAALNHQAHARQWGCFLIY